MQLLDVFMADLVGLGSRNHTLNLANFEGEMLKMLFEAPRVEIEFECEECGTILKVPTSYNLPEPDYLICSRCWAASNWAYRQQKMRERHSPDWVVSQFEFVGRKCPDEAGSAIPSGF